MGSVRVWGRLAALLVLCAMLSVVLAVAGPSADAQSGWYQVGADIDGEAVGDVSGRSVATNAAGDRVIIGAPLNDGNGDGSGQARVYQLAGGAWARLGGDIDGEAATDGFGGAVAMNAAGDRVIIGAVNNDGNGDGSGHARVYGYDGAAWVQLGADIDGEAAGDYSGGAVAMSAAGTTVIIGAFGNDGNGTMSGHARVFTLVDGNWLQVGGDIDGEAAYDLSGDSVSMNDAGTTVIIGADGITSGHARVYGYVGAAWVQVGGDIDGEAVGDGSG